MTLTSLIFSKDNILRLMRFGFTGLATNVLGYLLYLFVTLAGVPPKIAMTVLYVVGVLISFSANRRWVFARDTGREGAAVKFGIAYGIGYVLNYSILYMFVDVLHYPHVYAQAVGIVAVAAFIYVASSIYIFPSAGKGKRNL